MNNNRNIGYNARSVVAICSVLIAVAIMIAIVVIPKYSKGENENKTASDNTSQKSAIQSSEKAKKPETSAEHTTEHPTEKTSTITTEPPTKASETKAEVKNADAKKAEGSVDSEGKVSFSVPASYKNDYDYCVAVNRIQNVVTVYSKDANGDFTVPKKAMLASCGIKSPDGGIPTPTGTYSTLRKDRWLLLVGNCWGQYTTKVVGSIFFHSVPYYTKDASNLQYNEFPKLGQAASHGCIRLSCEDSKWIHDNLKLGTVIYIYDSNNPGPLGKPSPVPFDVNSPNKGWDPTDDDINNPWKK